jgi:spore coat protein U-like protein
MRRILLFIAMLLVFASPVRAQTCTASITSFNFGPISPATDSSASANGSVTVTCTGFLLTLPIRACISIGTGSGGTSYSPRYATSGANTLAYNLYSNSTASTIWGSRASGTYAPVTVDVPLTIQLGTVTGSATVPIYGRVAAGQSTLAMGTYTSIFSGAAQAEMTYQQNLLGNVNCATLTAGSTPLSFNVTANVINDCTLNATNINFGSTGVLNTTLSATGTLSVACTNNDAYSISLSAGGGSGASVADRRMTRSGGSDQVRYQLYQNASYTTPWGDGTGGTSTFGGTGSGGNQAFTVYGRVLPQTTPTAGSYTDTIMATITY